jgi:hypothetical protein
LSWWEDRTSAGVSIPGGQSCIELVGGKNISWCIYSGDCPVLSWWENRTSAGVSILGVSCIELVEG